MMIDKLSASTAIGSQAALGLTSASSSPATAAAAPSEDFSVVLGRLVNDATGVLQAGEDVAIQGIKGTASPLAVVNSVATAQQTLHSALAIRDKLVSAYQEISRLAI